MEPSELWWRAGDAARLAYEQFAGADNMTDRQGALGILANGVGPTITMSLYDQLLRVKFTSYSVRGLMAGTQACISGTRSEISS